MAENFQNVITFMIIDLVKSNLGSLTNYIHFILFYISVAVFYNLWTSMYIQPNLVIRNGLIRNKLVLRNHFLRPIVSLLHKDKEHLVLKNNFRVTQKFLITKFDCTTV